MESLKKILQAMVLSNAGSALTVGQLKNDYKSFEGCNIPHQEHGHANLESLLRSMPDVIQVSGQGESALVTLVVTEKSKHIREMILKQKKTTASHRIPTHVSSAHHRAGKGRTQPPSTQHTTTAVQRRPIALMEIIRALVISNPKGRAMTVKQLNADFKRFEGRDIPYQTFGFQQLDAMLLAMPDVVKLQGQGAYALVHPVLTQNSHHIAEMVVQQKNSYKRRAYVPPYAPETKRSCNASNRYNNPAPMRAQFGFGQAGSNGWHGIDVYGNVNLNVDPPGNPSNGGGGVSFGYNNYGPNPWNGNCANWTPNRYVYGGGGGGSGGRWNHNTLGFPGSMQHITHYNGHYGMDYSYPIESILQQMFLCACKGLTYNSPSPRGWPPHGGANWFSNGPTWQQHF